MTQLRFRFLSNLKMVLAEITNDNYQTLSHYDNVKNCVSYNVAISFFAVEFLVELTVWYRTTAQDSRSIGGRWDYIFFYNIFYRIVHVPEGVSAVARGVVSWALWLSSLGGLATAPSVLLFTGGPGPSPEAASICSWNKIKFILIFLN